MVYYEALEAIHEVFKWNLSKCRTKTDIYRTCHWQFFTNAWQFKTELSVTEVILKLQMPEIQDTLYYDFEKKNGIYFLKINGIKRMGFQGVLKGLFTVEFTEGEETYIVIHRCHPIQNLYASGYEAEIYEFMVKKLDCIPQ